MKSIFYIRFILTILLLACTSLAQQIECRSILTPVNNNVVHRENFTEGLFKLALEIEQLKDNLMKSKLMIIFQSQIQASIDLYGQYETEMMISEIYKKLSHQQFKNNFAQLKDQPSSVEIINQKLKVFPQDWGYFIKIDHDRIYYFGEFTTKPPVNLKNMQFKGQREIIDIQKIGIDSYFILKSNEILIWNQRNKFIQQSELNQPYTEIKQVQNISSLSRLYMILYKNGQFQLIGQIHNLDPFFLKEIDQQNKNNLAFLSLPMGIALIKSNGEIYLIDFQKYKVKLDNSFQLSTNEQIASMMKNRDSNNLFITTNKHRAIYIEAVNHEIKIQQTNEVQQITMNDYSVAILTNHKNIKMLGSLLHQQFLAFLEKEVLSLVQNILMNHHYLVLHNQNDEYQILKIQTGIGKQNPPRKYTFKNVQKIYLNNEHILFQLTNGQFIYLDDRQSYDLQLKSFVKDVTNIDDLGFLITTMDHQLIYVGHTQQSNKIQEVPIVVKQNKKIVGLFKNNHNFLIIYEDGTTQIMNEPNQKNMNYDPSLNKEPDFYLDNSKFLDAIIGELLL